MQDDQGLIYIANGDAILQYDGVEWRKLELPNLNRICTFAKDSQNRIFVGADKAFGYIDFDARGYMKFVSLVDKIPEEHRDLYSVWNVYIKDNLVFFTSNKKMYQWDGKTIEVLVSEYELRQCFLVGADLYFGIQEVGLSKLVNKAFKLIPGGALFKNTTISSILPFDEKSVLITTREKGMFLFNGNNFVAYPTEVEDYLKEFVVYKGLKLKEQYAFVTIYGGLVIMNQKGEKVQIITTRDGLLDNQIYGLGVDDQSGLWVTTQNSISRIEWFRPYSIFDDYHGLKGWVWDIQRHQGKLYLANSYGLHVLTKDSFDRHHIELVEKIKIAAWDLISVGENLIVGTGSGVFQYNDGGAKQINSLITTTLHQSQVDSNRIFIGHPKGLLAIYYRHGQWVEEGHAASIHQDILSIAETSSGDLWLGTRTEGVLHLKADENGKWGQYNVPDIYLEDKGIPLGWSKVYIINDEVMARTDCLLNEQCFHNFHKTDNKFIPDFEFVEKVSGKKGYTPSRYQQPDGHLLLQQLAGSESVSMLSAFQLGNGDYQLNTLQLGGIDQQISKCAYWDENKVLWLGGEAVVRYDLRFDTLADQKFPVYVRKVITANDSIIYAGLRNGEIPELRPDNNALRIEFAAPFFDLSEKNQYQYKLEGFDKTWSNWSTETKKDYTNLPAGHYEFKVRARNLYGTISEEGSYSFTILTPWYLSIYAYLLYGAVAIFVVWLLMKLRSQQLIKEKEILENLVAERTQEVSNQARQLEKQAHELQELDRLKSNFFANISHEFRTPLTLIKGPIDQLEQNPDEKLSPDNVKMIRRNADRMLKLVNQLLDLSKIDGGSLHLEPTEGDVFKCLRAAAASFNSHAAQRNIDYQVQIPQTVLWATFDRDKLEKVVYNLLSNAFKFSDDNAVISCQVKYSDPKLHVQVKDSGRGVPEEKLPYIFDRFYQVDSSDTKEKEGSGIGLSLSKNLVTLMNGTITVSSEIGKGSCFRVELPIQEIKTRFGESADKSAPVNTLVPRPKPFALTQTDKRSLPEVLLVEDNDDMRHFIKEQLIDCYKIREAVNGEAGLQKAIANPPDLIITDLMMPRMDGIELCDKLKTNVITSHIPVIMLTAKAGIDNKIKGLETGADDYLIKPFDANELLVRTKNLIEQRRKLRELFANKKVQIDPNQITVTSMDQKFLEQVLALLEDKSADPGFGVPQMQEALAMSKTQLHRKLKALTNEAPGELLRNFRLKRAARLLLQKADTVTQIAFHVGFNNLSYFAKCFKELYGVAPSSYK
ncbi:MAG: hybrid sensor histidine kinase/response regulator [Saprospiraceae bacterium]|nr:MAG: hybrid sensor histidine kinase/response regulator [Saprospiraceae bacterium]